MVLYDTSVFRKAGTIHRNTDGKKYCEKLNLTIDKFRRKKLMKLLGLTDFELPPLHLAMVIHFTYKFIL